jgi:hypothetical protein
MFLALTQQKISESQITPKFFQIDFLIFANYVKYSSLNFYINLIRMFGIAAYHLYQSENGFHPKRNQAPSATWWPCPIPVEATSSVDILISFVVTEEWLGFGQDPKPIGFIGSNLKLTKGFPRNKHGVRGKSCY